MEGRIIMEFSYTEEQAMVRDLAAKIAGDFGDEYWQKIDEEHCHPEEFCDALVAQGILSMALPEEYGGGGTGLLDLSIAAEALAEHGVGQGAVGVLVGGPVFGGYLISGHGTKEQKEKYLPGIAKGEMWAGAYTEPDSGSNVTGITTRAELKGDHYVVTGQKMFISHMDAAKYIAIYARTSPLDPKHKTRGLSMLVGELPDPHIEYRPFKKLGARFVNTSAVFIDGMKIPRENIVGEEGNVLKAMFDVLNPERIVVAASCIGTGLLAIRKAVEFANERVIWGKQPISSYQGLQFPLAEAKVLLEAARLKVYEAAWLFDQGSPKCGMATTMAKFAASHASLYAADRAIQTLGGSGYMCEYGVERLWRDLRLNAIAPVTNEMALNTIAQYDLGMPRSF
jgi:acyl-CoA dehydrogenase